jgi:very-short-patch-repair endonuclease/DNA polymerase III delta prime subunit
MSDSEISRKLISSRKELLDIGLRNSMINFRSGAKSLTITEERSQDVFRLLVSKEATMTFGYVPEGASKSSAFKDVNEEGEQEAATLALLAELDESKKQEKPIAPNKEANFTDKVLETNLTEERLFLTLLKIQTEAETFIQEQGVNVLFLALGFLHWYEDASSDKVRKAPLVLVPVELKRSGTRDAFKVTFTGDELIQNLSLQAKLKTDFGIDLPLYDQESKSDSDDLASLQEYFSKVSTSIEKCNRWKVSSDEIQLGFFSFGKFLMFKDLDPSVWPDDKQPDSHPVIERLLGDNGFAGESSVVPAGAHLDEIIQPGDVHFVRDADSTQTLAILEARGGRNLVIQGPPGTGKSQTITNIVAELIGNGKTVLFVAEKMAALDVVKRRLDENHLGDAVLELHSHKATKQSVLKELARTLDQGKPILPDAAEDIAGLQAARDELNDYCNAVNAPVEPSNVPFITALGNVLKGQRQCPGLAVWSSNDMKHWAHKDFLSAKEKVSELALHISKVGTPSGNPFWGCKLSVFSPIEQAEVQKVLKSCSDFLGKISDESSPLANRLRLASPLTISDVDVICRAAKRAAEAPKLTGIRISTNDWQLRRDAIRALIKAGSNMTAMKSKFGNVVIEQAWEQDLLSTRQQLVTTGEKWWRFLSGTYRAEKARLQGVCRSELPKSNSKCLELVDGILEYQRNKKAYDEHAGLGDVLFGAQWLQQDSDWDVLSRLSEWIFTLYDDLGSGAVPAGIVDFLAGHPDATGLGEAVVQIEKLIANLKDSFAKLDALISLDDVYADNFLDEAISKFKDKLALWSTELSKLYEQVRYNQLLSEINSLGLKDMSEAANDWDASGPSLTSAFELSWYSGIVSAAYARSPSLSRFDPIRQEHLIGKFRMLDQKSIGHAQAKLAKFVWDRQPNINQSGEMGIIRNEINKKRRHLPIRQLMDQAGRAVQAIKPVFMMSPMSIANFLPPGKLDFDVVIFDEASQVKAVDALGALLRGRQAIVVGDTKQMPPTDFFGRDIDTDDDDNVTSDIESILSMFRAKGAQERYLSWHYRSRHESLIAVSNVEFYDRKLVVFPAPGTRKHATGLKLQHIPNAIYDRGRTRTNLLEAKAVAAAVLDHARQRPALSLGVVAFSVAQRDLIQVEVELLRRKHSDVDKFFNEAHPSEPFFIKNLENVQGDERDCIFISIGYGRNESGRIAKEFGPVNREGGERRLNVLISRAKMVMEVFCNFRADELELDSNASHGVRALKHFLKYAETRELDIPIETGKDVDSPFEFEVMTAIKDKGYSVEGQVGTAGYFIDMAIKDPIFPGRYILAIECDGASYHSSRSARDRDRLRQGVLESLGWKFHRIWSTDWFRDPKKELDRVIEAIDRSREELANPELIKVPIAVKADQVQFERQANVEEDQTKSSIYKKAVLEKWPTNEALHEVQRVKLAELIRTVVDVESPVHEADITRRVMDSFGVSRAGNRIVDAVQSALQYGAAAGIFKFENGFAYAMTSSDVPVRNRSDFENTEKKIEHVAPIEIESALIYCVTHAFTISRSDAISEALNQLGFSRSTAAISGHMNSIVDVMLERQTLKIVDEKLMISSQ